MQCGTCSTLHTRNLNQPTYLELVPLCIPDSDPHRITSTKCRINTVVSPDDGPIVARNMKRATYMLRINCAPKWLYLQDYTGKHGKKKNIKKEVVFLSEMFVPIYKTPRRHFRTWLLSPWDPQILYEAVNITPKHFSKDWQNWTDIGLWKLTK